MPGSFKYPLLKLKRAKEHLDVLDAKLREFYETHTARVTDYEDDQNALYVRKIELPIIDPYLAVLAGDAIYSLRSSLDHIAWQLALTTKDRPFDRTEFPIVERDTSKSARRFVSVTRDIPDSAVNEIKALQPYLRGAAYKDDLLWKLDRLCNIDKHRVIPAQGTVLEFKIPKGIPYRLDTLDKGGIVTMPISVKAQMQLAPKPTCGILFGSEVDGCVVDLGQLGQIYDYTRNAVFPRFTRFFPE